MGRFKDRFLPDMYLCDIYELDISGIKSRGIEAVIFDIDNTLVTYDDAVAPERTIKFFERLREAGLKTYIVSNNNEKRVKKFSEPRHERRSESHAACRGPAVHRHIRRQTNGNAHAFGEARVAKGRRAGGHKAKIRKNGAER